MPGPYALHASENAEEHLWSHDRLYVQDAYDVLEGPYKVFRNPGRDDRVKLVGRDRGGRLLTIIITKPDTEGVSHIVTGWLADLEEQALYSAPGGSRNG